jgi:hypothetical protein
MPRTAAFPIKALSFARLATLTAGVALSLCAGQAAAAATECDGFHAVYTPYPAYKRTDGIHYRMTLENEACTAPLCPAAAVYVDTYSNSDEHLSRLTMHYSCAGGDGRFCYVSFPKDVMSDKLSEIKWNYKRVQVVAVGSDFNQTSFLGANGHAAHAFIFPDMPGAFGSPPIEWSQYRKSITVMSKDKDGAVQTLDEFAPQVWMLSNCKP